MWGHKVADYGFKRSTWNFLEAAHGKGAAGGVGGAGKRAADQQVIVKKKAITCAKDSVDLLSNTSSRIKLFLVDEITAVGDTRHTSPLHNIMKIHQV